MLKAALLAIESDKRHQELDEKLLLYDNKLKSVISLEAYKIFMEYESLSIEQEHNSILVALKL